MIKHRVGIASNSRITNDESRCSPNLSSIHRFVILLFSHCAVRYWIVYSPVQNRYLEVLIIIIIIIIIMIIIIE